MAAYHGRAPGATFVPGGLDDDYYLPPTQPTLVAPEPQRINPEMPNQIADGIQNMELNSPHGMRSSTVSPPSSRDEMPHLTPFPKLTNRPPTVPQSDEELESVLENAREMVLNSNDPEMQLAWAADALIYVGVCADDEERKVAARPGTSRSSTPRIEHQLKSDAKNIVDFLADQHHPKAEFFKGMWLEWGRFGQREDKKEAFRCYSRAADRNYLRAHYRIGMLYESYNDPIKALRHYNMGIEGGDSACCYRLGMMTLRGQHGQQQDYAKAIKLLKKSAESADENAAQGAYVYGMLLARQLPQISLPDGYLPYDEAAAKEHIERAAFLKFAKAQVKMGSMYELGSFGCPFDPALSIHYNALASKQGEAEADMALSKWFLVGHEGIFPKNEHLAYMYAERAAVSGMAMAEFAMGYFNEIGVSVTSNLDRAMEWYQKAASHGNTDAQGRIDGINRKQILNKKDHEKVAINRIKSQHNSVRGARPERLQKLADQRNATRPPPIAEGDYSPSNYDAHSPVAYSPANYAAASYNNVSPAVQAPGRGTTPYPVDNNPLYVAPLNVRPASVAPYPTSDSPPGMLSNTNRPGPAGGFFHPQPEKPRPSTAIHQEVRPSSAFQINPEIRSNSSMAAPQGQYHQGSPPYLPAAPYQQQHGGYPQGGPGPATRPVPGGRPIPNRIVSGPANLAPPRAQQNRIVSGPANMQSYGGPQGTPQPGMIHHQPTAPAAPQSHFSIGYSAPPDERQNRIPQRPPVQQQQQRPPASPTPPMPNFDQPKPQRQTQPPRPSAAAGPRLPAKDALPQRQQQQSKPGGKTNLPGKGPKTFEEMGVPNGKQDSDCVVM